MTRDEAIDKVLVQFGAKPLLIRLLLSDPPPDYVPSKIPLTAELMQYATAVSNFALAGRIVDALPLQLFEQLTPPQKAWLEENNEFEPIARSYAEVAMARFGFLHPDGRYEPGGSSGYYLHLPGPLPVGIPCMVSA